MQFHHDVAQPGRPVVLDAIPVQVFPHKIPYALRLIETRVHGAVGLARHQRVARRHPVGQRRVAVPVIRQLIGCREHVARGQHEHHAVVRRHQIREEGGAIGRRCRGAQQVARAVQQFDLHIRHAGLAHVLQPVGVAVQPHKIANRCWTIEADIEAEIICRRTGQIYALGHTVGVGIAVQAVVIRRVRHREEVARRTLDRYPVHPGCKVAELVKSVGARHRRSQDVRGPAGVQFHHDVAQPGRPVVLDAVPVEIFPDKIANAFGKWSAGRKDGIRHGQAQFISAVGQEGVTAAEIVVGVNQRE